MGCYQCSALDWTIVILLSIVSFTLVSFNLFFAGNPFKFLKFNWKSAAQDEQLDSQLQAILGRPIFHDERLENDLVSQIRLDIEKLENDPNAGAEDMMQIYAATESLSRALKVASGSSETSEPDLISEYVETSLSPMPDTSKRGKMILLKIQAVSVMGISKMQANYTMQDVLVSAFKKSGGRTEEEFSNKYAELLNWASSCKTIVADSTATSACRASGKGIHKLRSVVYKLGKNLPKDAVDFEDKMQATSFVSRLKLFVRLSALYRSFLSVAVVSKPTPTKSVETETEDLSKFEKFYRNELHFLSLPNNRSYDEINLWLNLQYPADTDLLTHFEGSGIELTGLKVNQELASKCAKISGDLNVKDTKQFLYPQSYRQGSESDFWLAKGHAEEDGTIFKFELDEDKTHINLKLSIIEEAEEGKATKNIFFVTRVLDDRLQGYLKVEKESKMSEDVSSKEKAKPPAKAAKLNFVTRQVDTTSVQYNFQDANGDGPVFITSELVMPNTIGQNHFRYLKHAKSGTKNSKPFSPLNSWFLKFVDCPRDLS